MNATHHLRSIADYHRLMELPAPQHPLISVLRFEDIKRHADLCQGSMIHYFYSIALKKNVETQLKYGQQALDFDQGVMHFMSPRQLLTIQASSGAAFTHTGWLLLIHPDFLWHTALANKIKQYAYFRYDVHEALHLAEKEEILVTDIMEKIAQEYQTDMDSSSHDVMIAQIELLLTYAERFYQRQFISRKSSSRGLLNQLDTLLTEYFTDDHVADHGIPSVQYIARQLHVSASYLSHLLQLMTGQSTKQFIHDKIIDLAKEKLSTTELSVNEIAYHLGFEHPQSFSKLFKAKTRQSPLEFRQAFNG